jgi:uncharacterized repeat protein (TIGR02543 family)
VSGGIPYFKGGKAMRQWQVKKMVQGMTMAIMVLVILNVVKPFSVHASSLTRANSSNNTVYHSDTKEGFGYYFIQIGKGSVIGDYRIDFSVGKAAYTGEPYEFQDFRNDENMKNNVLVNYSYKGKNIRSLLENIKISVSNGDLFSLKQKGKWFTYNDVFVGTTAANYYQVWKREQRQYNFYMRMNVKRFIGYIPEVTLNENNLRIIPESIEQDKHELVVYINSNNVGLFNDGDIGEDRHRTMKLVYNPIRYQVEYKENATDATGKMSNSAHTYDQEKNLSKNVFSRKRYIFTGWNTKSDGTGKSYKDQNKVKNLTSTKDANVVLYAQWEKKRFHVAYNGNKQTNGTNMLEKNIWLGDKYRFRNNVFQRTDIETRKTKNGTVYKVSQKYEFQSWEFDVTNSSQLFSKNQQVSAENLYNTAIKKKALSKQTSSSNPYQEVPPLISSPGTVTSKVNEYINLRVHWNAYPVIVIEPQPNDVNPDDQAGRPRIDGNILFFYEGEKPIKKDLISYLTVTDKEDGNLINKIKIKQVEYSDGAFCDASGKNKAGKTVTWSDALGMPDDYIFDTYYLEMIKDEVLTHFVTYEVTDSFGNTTTEKLPVKVKYNNPPRIKVDVTDNIFRYYKEEVNAGVITAAALIKRAESFDIEDGNKIKDKISLVNFNPKILKMQQTSTAVYPIKFSVTDRFHKTTTRPAKIEISDDIALDAEELRYYTRFIAPEYMETLEPTSTWRNKENQAYLTSVLANQKPIDIWQFTHEDIVKIKKWITAAGDGKWKRGHEANMNFLAQFGYCQVSIK